MSLVVEVVGAKNLPNVEKFGKIDPYVVVTFAGEKKKTEVIRDELNPTWNEKFEFNLGEKVLTSSDSLEIAVKSKEMIGRDRLVGTYTHGLQDVISSSDRNSKPTCQLQDGSGSPTTGEVSLEITYVDKPSPDDTRGNKEEPVGEESDASGDAASVDKDEDGEVDEDSEEDEDVGEQSDDSEAREHKFRNKSKQKKRSQLSTKPQEFQVRIKVWEGRGLAGGNVSPVCRVTVADQCKITRVKKSTNRPFWNEVFFFDIHNSPAELFRQDINFEVFNSRKLRSDALIGSFHMDVGTVYEEDKQVINNKWLLLTSPETVITEAMAMGYLRVSLSVIGSGDEAPQFKKWDETYDTESNLLCPAGMQLREGMFVLHIYNAEDIPQMDSGFLDGVQKLFSKAGDEVPKELVDPYMVAKFAGNKVKTKVKTCNNHPKWNEELRLPIRFPSMCERIKLQMKDWDRLSADDYIGTNFIDISTISSSGENGYLPTFGPSFVNFYGSTREFTDFPDEFDDLNKGKGTGADYRGRVMMSIGTKMGEHPEILSKEISQQKILSIQKFLRRRRYRLYCAFLDATMISETGVPVEFEVSIGNYGNNQVEDCLPQPSTTHPTNTMFDGCNYHYLLWEDKPLVVVNSDWEDVSFRLDTLNILLRRVERLQENINRVKLAIKAASPTAEVANILIYMIDELVADCRDPLPELDRTKTTDLDKRMYERRLRTLKEVIEEATQVKENATDVNEALAEVEGFLHALQEIAVEPQNCMPDINIWMLSGSRRIAYHRIPAYTVLYSSRSKDACGKYCGKVSNFFLKFPDTKGDNIGEEKIPGLLRVKMWLGLEEAAESFWKGLTDFSVTAFAETYENQVCLLGNWMAKNLSRPAWSDMSGKLSLPKDQLQLPPEWRWEGDWFVTAEPSVLYDADAGRKFNIHDAYEHECRTQRGRPWVPARLLYTDSRGDPIPHRNDIECPEGWKWDDDKWQIDFNRACDEDGFEYCVESTLGDWMAAEKTFHMCRRRRWIRPRSLVASTKQLEEMIEKRKRGFQAMAWEYAPLFNMKFHAGERIMDMVRRRRWHRKMVAESPKAFSMLSIVVGEEEDDENDITVPRLFLTSTANNKYELRAYLYQASDLVALDADSVSDPYACVSFLLHSQKSKVVNNTLCPNWNQTLIFNEIEIPGDPKSVADDPPDICIEIYDSNPSEGDEFLGRTFVKPVVKMDDSDQRVARLRWHTLYRESVTVGKLLASFELFLISENSVLPFKPPLVGDVFHIPTGIRPVMQRTMIEILCWGVRNMKKYQLAAVTSPFVEFEIGGKIVQSGIIKSTRSNPNFENPLMLMDIYLPKDFLYCPPINIRVRDKRSFGGKPVVGTACVQDLSQYRCDPNAEVTVAEQESQRSLDFSQVASQVAKIHEDESYSKQSEESDTSMMDESELVHMKRPNPIHALVTGLLPSLQTNRKREEYLECSNKDSREEDIDWWSKYYASVGEVEKAGYYIERGYDKLIVYNDELENNYDDFKDFCHTYELSRGYQKDDEEFSGVGEVKVLFYIYPLPDDPNAPMPPHVINRLPSSKPMECVVRVYIIKAIDLQPRKPTGLSNPYLKVKLGNKTWRDTESYKSNTLNPVFGKMFEFQTIIPIYKDLVVSVWDHDKHDIDDLIGETRIDIENRVLTKYRATCGLPETFNESGPNKWRDSQSPKEILEDYCKKNVISSLFYTQETLRQMERFMLKEAEGGPADQHLALRILHTLPLVQEHVETRRLYNPLTPGIVQGRLQMFVDIFPLHLGPPGPAFEMKEPVEDKEDHDVMISYQWDSQPRMLKLKEELEKADVNVWMDVTKMAGNIDDRMAEGVKGAKVILMCFSKKYEASANCKKEAQFADLKKKKIIPLKYDDHEPDKWLGILIGKLLYYDVRTEESMMKNLQGILNEIKEVI